MDEVNDDAAPVLVTRKNARSVVIIGQDEYESVNTPSPEGGRLLKQAMRPPAGLTLQGPLLPPLSKETLDA